MFIATEICLLNLKQYNYFKDCIDILYLSEQEKLFIHIE